MKGPCKEHPRYVGKGKPTSKCPTCIAYYRIIREYYGTTS